MYYKKYLKYKIKYEALIKSNYNLNRYNGGATQLALQSSDIRDARIRRQEDEKSHMRSYNRRLYDDELETKKKAELIAILDEQFIYQKKEKHKKIIEEIKKFKINKIQKEISIEEKIDNTENILRIFEIELSDVNYDTKLLTPFNIKIKQENIKDNLNLKNSLSGGLFKLLNESKLLDNINYCEKNDELHKYELNYDNTDDLFINKLSMKDIIKLYKLINLLTELLSIQHIKLKNSDFRELSNIRFYNNSYYKIPSILTKEENYIDIINDINSYIININRNLNKFEVENIKLKLTNQIAFKDSDYLNNDKIYIDIIENLILENSYDSITFQELFLLEYSLKRLIQDKLTEYILNYSVAIDENSIKVYKENNIYSYFILKTVKDIEKKIKEDLLSDKESNIFEKLESELVGNAIYKNFIIQQLKYSLDIKIILKGGNLIKFLYNNNLQIDSKDTFSLSNYNDYYSDLSDYDFDIKIKFFDPLVLTPFFKDLRLCNNKYMELFQIIKSHVMIFINDYFLNIKQNFNNIESIRFNFNMIEFYIKCNINLFNKYLNYFSLLDSEYSLDKNISKIRSFDTIINTINDDLFNIPFLNIQTNNLEDNWSNEGNCNGALKKLKENSCNLSDKTIYKYLNCKNLPRNIPTKESIFSYISSQYIGNLSKTDKMEIQFFDLTRLCLRLDIMNLGIRSKAECIDFGLYNFTKQSIEKGQDGELIYNYKLFEENIIFKGQNIKYLIDELIVLIFTAATKKSKRLHRIFKILDKMIEKNYSIFKIIMSENKFM
jgi:hypothetical protein